ncbi:secreted frizzled-related protein 3 isoform X2 [Hypanus sabinus]|uniref:secreted frizzled-related protein 3 isoform X2 n=1 Tax=Hypanus sabinus TaxID=79690 RepID=UPI0028C47954|nr:secreted frizzled-related protein 3 isoform X2 [Hypanus sabinus]
MLRLGGCSVFLWVSYLSLGPGLVRVVQAAACEPIRIPMCKPMPWNMTKMPNHLHHSTQDNAVLAIEQYEGLVGTDCSPVLLFFLCAMYAPICTIDFQHEPIKPCKSVCERARDGCEPVMRQYNHTWPENLACEEFPVYDRGVCISPEAIVTADAPAPDLSIHSSNNNCRNLGGGGCRCPAVKLTQKVYLKNNYNYVIRAKVKEVKSKCHDVATTVEVKDVLKSSLVNIPKETVTLHTSSACLCPEIRTNEEYVIMGYEDEERARLLLVEGSIAVKWKDRLGKRIKNWDQRLRQDRRKGRSGQQNGEKRLQPRDTAVASRQRNKRRNAKQARQ